MDAAAAARPHFSVIVLNWNGRHLLGECLDALREQTFRDFETIVVDNGSTDGSLDEIRGRASDGILLVALERNTGYAGGNNRGLEAARGAWAVFLNNDTQADPRWLEALHDAARRHPDVQVFACKVLNHARRDEIDTVGHLLYPDGINRGRGRLETDRGQYDREEEVFFPSGCAAAYRRDLLATIGGFDESFFAYGDDTDLGLRARVAGARCLLAPRAVVYHKYSGTAGSYSEFKVYQVERNRVWVLLKYVPLRWILVSPFYTMVRMACHAAAAWSGRGASGKYLEGGSGFALARTVLRAYRDALAGVPRALRERRRIRPLRRASSAQFAGWLRRFRLTAREVAWKE